MVPDLWMFPYFISGPLSSNIRFFTILSSSFVDYSSLRYKCNTIYGSAGWYISSLGVLSSELWGNPFKISLSEFFAFTITWDTFFPDRLMSSYTAALPF